MNSLNVSLLAFLFFILLVGLHCHFVEPSLEGLAVGTSQVAIASGGSDSLLVYDLILLGNNSIINYSNGIYGNVGPNANYTFTLGILYNSDAPGNIVTIYHYKINGSIGNLISLGTQEGVGLVMSGMARAELLTGEYVQILFGANTNTTLAVLPGSAYSVIRIPQE